MSDGMTLADKHCADIDLKMVIITAKTLPASEREPYLRGWRYIGPHKSAVVQLDDSGVQAALEWCAR